MRCIMACYTIIIIEYWLDVVFKTNSINKWWSIGSINRRNRLTVLCTGSKVKCHWKYR